MNIMMTVKIQCRTTSLNIISLLLVVSLTVATTNNEKLIEWLRSKGGYWNPRQTLTSQDGLFGVFANEHINENEILASIPWSCTITLEEDDDDTEEAEDRFKNCDMVQTLADEISKGNESTYALYVQGLVDTAKEHSRLLPSYWSQQGKDLLLKIIDNGTLPPDNILIENDEWKKKCEKINKDTTLLVMTHGENFGMVPITDKYNSRSGNWTGAYFSIEGGGYGDKENVALEIRAYRDLEANEQIFTNYKDYGQIGTPELLRDYGFVEFYPQTWIFHKQQIAFDIIEPKIGELEIYWKRRGLGKRYNDPGERTVKFLREQLQRLEQDIHPVIEQSRTIVGVESENESPSSSSSSSTSLSEHEFQVINRFYNDLTIALRLAITYASEKYNIGNGMHGDEF
jgi:hypothetical protein